MADEKLVSDVAEVDGVRRDVAERVVEAFPTREQLAGASLEDLTEVKGIGQVTAERIRTTFSVPDNVTELHPEPAEAPEPVEEPEPVTETAAEGQTTPTSDEEPEAAPEAPKPAEKKPAIAAASSTSKPSTDRIRATSPDDGRPGAAEDEGVIERLHLAYNALTAGATAAADTAKERWPEVRGALGDAAGEVKKLTKTVTSSVVNVIKRPLDRAS